MEPSKLIKKYQPLYVAGMVLKTLSGRSKTLTDGILYENKNLGTVYAHTTDSFDTTIMNKNGKWLHERPNRN